MIKISRVIEAIRVGVTFYKLDIRGTESWNDFNDAYRVRHHNATHFTEGHVRKAYDLWRRGIIENEVKAEFDRTRGRELLMAFVNDKARRTNLITMIVIVLAVLFPPYYIVTADQSVSLGLGFAFTNHFGRIDAMFLLCELIGIGALSWLAHRVLSAPPATP